ALATDRVRYIGDNVAAVAATTEEAAERALELIEVEYEPLTAWFDPLEAMKAEEDWIHERRPHNIEKEYHHEFGNLEEGFSQAAFVQEERFYEIGRASCRERREVLV